MQAQDEADEADEALHKALKSLKKAQLQPLKALSSAAPVAHGTKLVLEAYCLAQGLASPQAVACNEVDVGAIVAKAAADPGPFMASLADIGTVPEDVAAALEERVASPDFRSPGRGKALHVVAQYVMAGVRRGCWGRRGRLATRSGVGRCPDQFGLCYPLLLAVKWRPLSVDWISTWCPNAMGRSLICLLCEGQGLS